jgi:hypothetical protein
MTVHDVSWRSNVKTSSRLEPSTCLGVAVDVLPPPATTQYLTELSHTCSDCYNDYVPCRGLANS